jgi:hypothetical protein
MRNNADVTGDSSLVWYSHKTHEIHSSIPLFMQIYFRPVKVLKVLYKLTLFENHSHIILFDKYCQKSKQSE